MKFTFLNCMLSAQVHHLLCQPNQICVPYPAHTAMNGLRVVVKQVELQGNITKRVLSGYFSKEGNADPSEDETDYIPLLCNKSNVDDLLSTHMGDRKLAPNKLP